MEDLALVEAYLCFGRYPDSYCKGEKANLRRKCHNNFKFTNGVLYYKMAVKAKMDQENWRICVRTDEEKQSILESCHAGAEGNIAIYIASLIVIIIEILTLGGHLGRDKTIEKVLSRFYWKNINGDVRKFVQCCDKCQRTNATFKKSNATLHPVPVHGQVWHTVGV